MIDKSTGPGGQVARRLRGDRVASTAATIRTPGRRSQPVWTWWTANDNLCVFSLAAPAPTQNIKAIPKVSLDFAGDGYGGDIVILSGAPRSTDGPAAHEVRPTSREQLGLRAAAHHARAVRPTLLGPSSPAHQGARPQSSGGGPATIDTWPRLPRRVSRDSSVSSPTQRPSASAARAAQGADAEFLFTGTNSLAQLRFTERVDQSRGLLAQVLRARAGARPGLASARPRPASGEGARLERIKTRAVDKSELLHRRLPGLRFSLRPKPPGRTLFLGKRL